MKWINNFKIFEDNNTKESPKRSGRLLTDAQRHYEENQSEETGVLSPAMLFTDVVGSSKMWSDDPQTMSIQLDKYGGFVVKTIGDSFMIYFGKSEKSLEVAIDFAVEVLKYEELPLRIGICSGKMTSKKCRIQDVELVDFFGDVVNTASRMESKVAEKGGIAFTSVDNISNQLKSISKKYRNLIKIEGTGIPDLHGVKVPVVYKINL